MSCTSGLPNPAPGALTCSRFLFQIWHIGFQDWATQWDLSLLNKVCFARVGVKTYRTGDVKEKDWIALIYSIGAIRQLREVGIKSKSRSGSDWARRLSQKTEPEDWAQQALASPSSQMHKKVQTTWLPNKNNKKTKQWKSRSQDVPPDITKHHVDKCIL